MKNLLLIDLNWTYNRFYYIQSIKEPTKPQEATNKALLEFFTILNNLKEFQNIFVLMDGKQPKNKLLLDTYKSGRSDKTEVYKGLESFSKQASKLSKFTVLYNEYAEADELIAYICSKHFSHSSITIYSGDKDLLQLKTLKNIQISNKFTQGKFIYLSDEEILQKFSNSTKSKYINSFNQILTYKVLKGDLSDSIPAPVKRVKFESLLLFMDLLGGSPSFFEETFISACEKLKEVDKSASMQLLEHKEDIKRNYKLISLLDFTGKDYIKENTIKVE